MLNKEDKDFSITGLKKDSVFKMNKIATLDKNTILGKLGQTPKTLQEKLDQKLKNSLGLA